jgi:hypothetical protein
MFNMHGGVDGFTESADGRPMNAFKLDSGRSARFMLGTIIGMLVFQVLLAAFRPGDAHALARWGGGYEVQATGYGYILMCEEPKDEIFDPLYASRVWRRTIHSTYAANWSEAMRVRDAHNLWFKTVGEHYPKSVWLGKRCLSGAGHRPQEFRQVWYYIGLDGSEFRTDTEWARSSLSGTFAS